MKLLVIGIDALDPGFLKENIEGLPNIKKLAQNGILGEYDGYVYGYGSCDNWISLYTGVSPETHGTIKNTYIKTGESTKITDYEHLDPFWKVLNENGYKVGMWKALRTSPPQDIEGYMASGEVALEDGLEDSNLWCNEPIFTLKNRELAELIKGKAPKMPMPKGPEYLGYSWEDVWENTSILKALMTEDYFRESISAYKDNLEYQIDSIRKVNAQEKVDLFWFYDPIYDFISHFVNHDTNKTVLKEVLLVVDWFVGELIDILKPENIILLSDHGQLSFGEHFPNTSLEIKKEAFGVAEQSIFVDDQIFMPARNGGVLTASHSLKASIILSGNLFDKDKEIKGMRNLDFYPLLLEMFDCEVPEGREGYIHSLLIKEQYINEGLLYPNEQTVEEFLLIANLPVYEMNAFINQFYLKNRFIKINVFTDLKYKKIYSVNPQVNNILTSPMELKNSEKITRIIIPTLYDKYNLYYEEYCNFIL